MGHHQPQPHGSHYESHDLNVRFHTVVQLTSHSAKSREVESGREFMQVFKPHKRHGRLTCCMVLYFTDDNRASTAAVVANCRVLNHGKLVSSNIKQKKCSQICLCFFPAVSGRLAPSLGNQHRIRFPKVRAFKPHSASLFCLLGEESLV